MSYQGIRSLYPKLYEEKIDDEITPTILEIIKFQNKMIAMSNERLDKFIELDKKYDELRKPINEMISEITMSIPNFWVHLFSSDYGLRMRAGEGDYQILKYMTSIEVDDFESGFSISFNFRSNPFFENERLTKKFEYLRQHTPKVTTTGVHWKEEGKEIYWQGNSKRQPTYFSRSFFYHFFDEAHQGVERNDDPVCKVDSDFQVTMSYDLCTGTLIKFVWDDILRYIKEALIRACDEAGYDDHKEWDYVRGRSVVHPIQRNVAKLEEVEYMLSKNDNDLKSAKSEVHKEFLWSCKLVRDMRNECIKSCPDFWMKAFFGYPALDKHVRPKDREIFMYLTSIEVEDQDPTDLKSDTSISFSFSPNPYFEDTKLTKTFKWGDMITFEATAAKINWKEGKSVLTGLDCGKKRNKRPRIKESFFNWFIETYEDKDIVLPLVAEHIKVLWNDPVKYFIKYVKAGASKSGDGDKEYVAIDVANAYDDEFIKYYSGGDDDVDDDDVANAVMPMMMN